MLQLRRREREQLLPPLRPEGRLWPHHLAQRVAGHHGRVGRGHPLFALHAVATAVAPGLPDKGLHQRQAVKMLVVMAVLVVLVYGLLGIGFEAEVENESGNNAVQGFLMGDFYDWMSNHIEWAVLAGFSMFIVPVWFLFRTAPRLPRHTLPQGFFIQVFVGVQFLLYMLIVTLVFDLIPSLSGSGDEAAGFMVMLVLPLMLWCDYKQLFGYGWWGTLWRIVASVFLAIAVTKVLVRVGGLCYCLFVGDRSLGFNYLVGTVDHSALLWVLLEVVLLINAKPWRGNIAWPRILLRPLIAVATLLLTTAACGQFGIENSVSNMIKSMQTMFLP